MKLEKLQDTNKTLAEELNDLRTAHQKEVREQSSGQKHRNECSSACNVALKSSSTNQYHIAKVFCKCADRAKAKKKKSQNETKLLKPPLSSLFMCSPCSLFRAYRQISCSQVALMDFHYNLLIIVLMNELLWSIK